MQLGIVMTDDRFVTQVVGLLDAAHARGWPTLCFLTDAGVKVLGHEDFIERAKAWPNMVSVCEHSIEKHAADTIDIQAHADFVIIGGQYQNAELARKCDKVLVF